MRRCPFSRIFICKHGKDLIQRVSDVFTVIILIIVFELLPVLDGFVEEISVLVTVMIGVFGIHPIPVIGIVHGLVQLHVGFKVIIVVAI